MAINFPDSPTLNDTHVVGDITWTWDGTSWVATAAGNGGGVNLTAFSVSTLAASGGGSLTYNNTNGLFSFRPADVSNFVTGSVGVTPGVYGDAGNIAQITVNEDGQITNVTEISASGGGTTNAERFKLNYASDGTLASTSDLTSGISSVVIDSASGGETTITFNSSAYNYPPVSVLMYGYDYNNNLYVVTPVETTMTTRTVAAGGSSGSPTLFNGSGTVTLRLTLTESNTGASRGGFGTTTHAWIQFAMSGI